MSPKYDYAISILQHICQIWIKVSLVLDPYITNGKKNIEFRDGKPLNCLNRHHPPTPSTKKKGRFSQTELFLKLRRAHFNFKMQLSNADNILNTESFNIKVYILFIAYTHFGQGNIEITHFSTTRQSMSSYEDYDQLPKYWWGMWVALEKADATSQLRNLPMYHNIFFWRKKKEGLS